jgi:hypothetical protein
LDALSFGAMKVKKVLSPGRRARILFYVDSRDELFVWTEGSLILTPGLFSKRGLCRGSSGKNSFFEERVSKAVLLIVKFIVK